MAEVAIIDIETDQKALSIEFSLNACRRTVHADPMRLEQVIRNVIRNAIMYSPSQGAIRVQTSNIVFDAFKQGDRLHVGLAIARAFITLYSGSITAQSAGIGQGTTIHILLPTVLKSTPIVPIDPHYHNRVR